MTTQAKKKPEEKKPNKSGAEKPVNLWGASFIDVMNALLKTKPSKERKNANKISTK